MEGEGDEMICSKRWLANGLDNEFANNPPLIWRSFVPKYQKKETLYEWRVRDEIHVQTL